MDISATGSSIFPSSTIVAYFGLAVLAIYQILHCYDFPILPVSELAWNVLVYLTPSRLLAILDASGGRRSGNMAEGGNKSLHHAMKSEMMRRILGLNETGFVNRLQQNTSISSIGTLFHAGTSNVLKDSPPGLGNWDNSCYQNSVIQGLASLPSLADFLSKTSGSEDAKSTRKSLSGLISKLNDPLNAGKMLWTPAELKSMSSWQQQDAQEYFSKLVDEVEKETLRMARSKSCHNSFAEAVNLTLDGPGCKPRSKIRYIESFKPSSKSTGSRLECLPDELISILARNPLEGLLAQRVGCLQCGFVEGLTLIPFNCLTVPLGKQRIYNFRACLDDYTALEHISGVECTKCTLLRNKTQMERLLSETYDQAPGQTALATPCLTEAQQNSINDRLAAVNEALNDDEFSDNTLLQKCQIPAKNRVSSTKSRQAIIARTPKSLVIHVNRSVFDEFSGVQRKNFAEVKFPLQFDLSHWCLGGRTSRNENEAKVEGWSTDPSKSMLSGEIDDLDSGSTSIYVLRAIITHFGRHENGHYICYRKHRVSPRPDINSAAKTNESWWRLSDQEVSEVTEETVLAQGGVFMLFYEKMEQQVSKMLPVVPLSGPIDISAKEPIPVEPRSEETAREGGASEGILDPISAAPCAIPPGVLKNIPSIGSISPPNVPETQPLTKPNSCLTIIAKTPEASAPSTLLSTKELIPTPDAASPSLTLPIAPQEPLNLLPAPSSTLSPITPPNALLPTSLDKVLHSLPFTTAVATSTPQDSASIVGAIDTIITPSPTPSKEDTTTTNTLPSSPPSTIAPTSIPPTSTIDTTQHPSPQTSLSSPLMRTAPPRPGRGSVSRGNKGLGGLGSSVVFAN